LTYDVQGNLSLKNNTTYVFDYGNRLRSTSGGAASSYVYDGNGRRVRDFTSASKYSLYNQAGQLAFTSDFRTTEYANYIYLGGSLIATRTWPHGSGGTVTTRYQHTDALGSPVVVTDANRNVVERSDYEPYGKVVNRPVHDGPGFTGHVEDATTGLTYMQQRYYDPAVGRFLSVDPVTADGATGANFNRYWYANDNPYRFTDPDGREPKSGYVHDTCGITGCQIGSFKQGDKNAEQRNTPSSYSGGFWLPHRYGGPGEGDWPICTSDQEWCTQNIGYEALTYYGFPGQDNSRPIANDQVSQVKFLGLSGGEIQTKLDPQSYTLTNITRSNHIFCCGFVRRTIVWEGRTLMLRTSGSGVNYGMASWYLNYLVWRPAFNQYNHLIQMKMIQIWSSTQK